MADLQNTFTLWVQFEDNSVLTSQHESVEDAQKEFNFLLEEIKVNGSEGVISYEINPNKAEPTHYVSTTLGTTWMGEIESMREDYRYYNLFYGTEEECLEELECRRNEN